jgi:hypothetical protein
LDGTLTILNLDFVPADLDFVPSGLDFVPKNLDFVPGDLDFLHRARELVLDQTRRAPSRDQQHLSDILAALDEMMGARRGQMEERTLPSL